MATAHVVKHTYMAWQLYIRIDRFTLDKHDQVEADYPGKLIPPFRVGSVADSDAATRHGIS